MCSTCMSQNGIPNSIVALSLENPDENN